MQLGWHRTRKKQRYKREKNSSRIISSRSPSSHSGQSSYVPPGSPAPSASLGGGGLAFGDGEEEDEYDSFLDKFLSVENEYDMLPYPAFSVVMFTVLIVEIAWLFWASTEAQVNAVAQIGFVNDLLGAFGRREPCMNPVSTQEELGCAGFSSWYDKYQEWYPAVAAHCGNQSDVNLGKDNSFSWTTTNVTAFCNCLGNSNITALEDICKQFPIWMSMTSLIVPVLMIFAYITLTITGWETTANTYQQMMETRRHLRRQFPKDIQRYSDILDGSFMRWRRALPNGLKYFFFVFCAVGSLAWMYKGFPFVQRAPASHKLIVFLGWAIETYTFYLGSRAFWQAIALYTENYSLVFALGQPQNFKSLKSVQCWWAVREYVLQYKLALNYRLNEFAFSILTLACVVSIGFLVSQAFTEIDDILAPSSCNFIMMAVFLTVFLLGLMNLATAIYQTQQKHAKMLHDEEHKLETNPSINPAQLRSTIKFMHKATHLLKYDRAPTIFSIPIKPEAFYALIFYVVAAFGSIIIRGSIG